MVLGDANEMLEKKSKKRKKNAATNNSGVTKGDVNAVECDLSFKEEKLSLLRTRKERDEAKIESKECGESEDCDSKRKKERGGGKMPRKSSEDRSEDAVKNVVKKKNKLKSTRETMHDALLDTKTLARESEAQETKEIEMPTKGSGKEHGESEDCDNKREKERGGGKMPRKSSKDSCEDAVKNVVKKKNKLNSTREIMHDALLDAKTLGRESASEAQETKVIETPTKGSGGDAIAEDKRKRKNREQGKKEDRQVGIDAGVNQGDVSTVEKIADSNVDDANPRKRKRTKLGHNSKDLTHEKSEKRVRFSDDVQVFHPSSDLSDGKHEMEQEKLLFGKWFTQEEDEIVKDAVYKYIEVYNLGEEGLQKVLDCQSNPELKGCWKEIGRAIPYRPYRAVYFRAQRLFRMGEKRNWTEEEFDMVRKFHGEHGPKWKVLADELGKHAVHVGNTWNRIKLANRKRGNWAQEEIQTLFDLVNADLQMKLCEEKKSKHGMLRDNICWSAISDRLSTRISQHCCNKWYRQLTSPMVATGEWADTDDYRLIDALFELDASCIEDVDWGNLLDHRPGELCRKRWKQMVHQISRHENKSFTAQVEVLAKRYRPDLVGAREEWDRKPIVP